MKSLEQFAVVVYIKSWRRQEYSLARDCKREKVQAKPKRGKKKKKKTIMLTFLKIFKLFGILLEVFLKVVATINITFCAIQY